MNRPSLLTASILTIAMGVSIPLRGQVYSNKVVGKKHTALADSLKQMEYPYVLPIWGAKATAAGFNLPYSAGVGTQFITSEADILIDNLQVGFNGGTLHDMDEVVRFDRAVAQVSGFTVRPDVWVLPFLNVYAILGYNSASTDVGYGLWLPDSSGVEHQVFRADTKVEFNATLFGLGLTPTVGVGGGWLALDMNFTWSDIPQLEDPAFAFVFDPRLGKTFKFKAPDRNVSAWVGGFRLAINTGTNGSIPLADAMPIDQWSSRIDQGFANLTELDNQIDTWWNGLSALEQANPINQARHNAANRATDAVAGFLESADRAVNTAANSTVDYAIDKRPKDMWNFIVGGQFQYNKHWMLRGEYGFLSSRQQLLVGLQYRFGL